ncbi:thiamine-phosphate kinase [Calditrichota bacterium]
MNNISELGEFELINKISDINLPQPQRVIKGIGDDCAVVRQSDGSPLLITVDQLVDGVHFKKELHPPRLLGKKLLAINLSDIASMGGKPLDAVVTAQLPGDTEVSWLEEFFKGLEEMATEFKVNIVGGDTTSSSAGLSFTLTLTGVPISRTIYRSGALPGDDLYVTGHIGDSAAGLHQLLHGADPSNSDSLLMRYLSPEPRIELGLKLAKLDVVHAMTDVSDSLAIDINNIGQASNQQLLCCRDLIPLSPELIHFCRNHNLDSYKLALTGGGDYELLFSAAPSGEQIILDIAKTSGVKITKIGAVGDAGVKHWRDLMPDRMLEQLEPDGWEHFRS